MTDQLDDLLKGFQKGPVLDYETISGLSEIFSIWQKESDSIKEELIKKRLLIIVAQVPITIEGFSMINNLWQQINTWSNSAAMGVVQEEKLNPKEMLMNQIILNKYTEILSTIPKTKDGLKALKPYSVYLSDGFKKLPDIIRPYHDKTVEILPFALPDIKSFLSISCLLQDKNIGNNPEAMKLIDQRGVEIIENEFPKINNFWAVGNNFWHYRLPGNSNSNNLMLEKMEQIFRNTPITIEGFENLGSFHTLAKFHDEIWSLLSQVMIERLPSILPQIQDLKMMIPYFEFVRCQSEPFKMLLNREAEIVSTISDFEELMTCKRIGGDCSVMGIIKDRIIELLREVTKENFPDSLKKVLQWNLAENERELFLETIEKIISA